MGGDGDPSAAPPSVRAAADTATEEAQAPARVHEKKKKKRRPRRLSIILEGAALHRFFTAGLEIDDAVDPELVARFDLEFSAFTREFGVSTLWGEDVEFKFRRLGRHRADGLYYPEHRVLAIDSRTLASFAHEFGHLIDYRSRDPLRGNRPLSGEEWFAPLRSILVDRMRRDGSADLRLIGGRGRLSLRYYAQPAECFARAFEQFVAERVLQPSSIVGVPERYRSDPIFFQELPAGLAERFRSILAGGPIAASRSTQRLQQPVSPGLPDSPQRRRAAVSR